MKYGLPPCQFTEKLQGNWVVMLRYMPAKHFPGDDHIKMASGLVFSHKFNEKISFIEVYNL